MIKFFKLPYIKKIFCLMLLLFFTLNSFCFSSPSIIKEAKTSDSIDKTKKLNRCVSQLHQMSEAHGQCLIYLQQLVSENQQEIDELRGQIQKIRHDMLDIVNNYKNISHKLNSIKINDNELHITHDTKNVNNQEIKKNNIQQKKNDNSLNHHVIESYNNAVALVLEKKQYNKAIQAFKDFVKNYPESSYQANAHYWLGQLYYNNGNKENSAYHFALVAKNYPKSLKASDALLKIGIIMQETEKYEKAKIIYQQVEKLYSNSDAAKQAKKRLNCLQ